MKTLLFDYGGTLDTAARHWNYVLLDGYRHVAARFPEMRKVEGEAWRKAYVHGERMLAKSPVISPADDFRELLLKKIRIEIDFLRASETIVLSSEQAESAASHVADYCDGFARNIVSESRSILAQLATRRYRFVLVTNFYGNIRAVLRAYGIDRFFPDIVESAVVGVRKPDPAIWQLGVEVAGAAADECIAIGDSYGKDIVPAQKIGCQTIWFKGEEWEEKQYDETLPTHIITRLSQLLDILK